MSCQFQGKSARCRGDVGSISGRCQADTGPLYGRCLVDMRWWRWNCDCVDSEGGIMGVVLLVLVVMVRVGGIVVEEEEGN